MVLIKVYRIYVVFGLIFIEKISPIYLLHFYTDKMEIIEMYSFEIECLFARHLFEVCESTLASRCTVLSFILAIYVFFPYREARVSSHNVILE